MVQDEFENIYRVLEEENPSPPVFFTAMYLLGIRVGAVQTELDLSQNGGIDGHNPLEWIS